MFRAVHTPIIRSTGLTVSTVIGTIIGQAHIVPGTASQCSLVRTRYSLTCTPDDGRVYRTKHVEWTCREINSLHIVASVGHSIEYYNARNNKYKILVLHVCSNHPK